MIMEEEEDFDITHYITNIEIWKNFNTLEDFFQNINQMDKILCI